MTDIQNKIFNILKTQYNVQIYLGSKTKFDNSLRTLNIFKQKIIDSCISVYNINDLNMF